MVSMQDTVNHDKKLNHAIAKEKHGIYLSFNKWRECILTSFGYDPLKCPCCGNTMSFLELYHNHHRVPLDEIYKKVMANAKGCRSPAYHNSFTVTPSVVI